MAGLPDAQLMGPDALHAVRQRVYLRHGGYCTYCGRVLHVDEVCLDHDEASWANVASEDELRCACFGCHAEKGERTRHEYRTHRRMVLARQMLASLASR